MQSALPPVWGRVIGWFSSTLCKWFIGNILRKFSALNVSGWKIIQTISQRWQRVPSEVTVGTRWCDTGYQARWQWVPSEATVGTKRGNSGYQARCEATVGAKRGDSGYQAGTNLISSLSIIFVNSSYQLMSLCFMRLSQNLLRPFQNHKTRP